MTKDDLVSKDTALKMAIEEKIDLMDGWAKAYPESIFTPVTDEELKKLEEYKKHLGMRISAQMGRHIGKHFEQIIKLLEKCKEALEQPAQEPLSFETILNLEQKHTDLLVGGGTIFHFEEFARDIEQAHGIGEKDCE
jgi:hypothetical protein